MKTHFDIEQFIQKGTISNELDLERAMIADRKLRLLAKDNAHFKSLRTLLRDMIEEYETKNWSNTSSITDANIAESDKYEYIAEMERVFLNNRKLMIKHKLKEYDLTQENLAKILGHKSKTHMSELMTGLKPFTLRDLIIINRLLKIDITILVPNFLSMEDQIKIKSALNLLNKPHLKLEKGDLVYQS